MSARGRIRFVFRASVTTALTLSTLAGTPFCTGVALAQPAKVPKRPTPEAEAREAMQSGIALFGRGDAKGALREYERAKRLVPAANLPYRYAAEALSSLDRPREAAENLRTYLQKNPAVSDAEQVQKRIVEIEAKLSRGDLAVRAARAGARARIDGQAVYDLPHDFSLPAGEHTVVVEGDGYVRLEQRVQIVAGKRDELFVTLVPKPGERGPTPVPTPTPPALRERAATAWPTVGAVGIGLGAAAVIVGAVVDATALGAAFDDVDAAARAGDPRLTDEQSAARGLRTGVQVTYVAGVVTLVAGAAVLLLAPHHMDATDTRAATRSPFSFRF